MSMSKFICPQCGKENERDSKYLRQAARANRLSFCNNSCATKYHAARGSYSHVGNIHNFGDRAFKRKMDEYSPYRYYIRKAKNKLGNIAVLDVKNQWEMQEGKCALTGLPMSLNRSRNDPRLASLDRIDSSLPYQKGNIQFVCWAINLAKNTLSQEAMISFIEDIRNQS